MSDERSPDVWQMVFEQTPVALRWVFGVLSLGIFTLASVLYKWHRDDMKRVREQQREDMNQTRDNINRIHRRIDELRGEMNQGHQVIYKILTERNGQ